MDREGEKVAFMPVSELNRLMFDLRQDQNLSATHIDAKTYAQMRTHWVSMLYVDFQQTWRPYGDQKKQTKHFVPTM